VVGNSLGGAIAVQLSVHVPDRVKSLILINSAGFGREVTIALRLLAIRPLGRLLLRPSATGARRTVRSLLHHPAFVTDARVQHALGLATKPHGVAVLLESARSLGTFRGVRRRWREELLITVAANAKPALVVWGDRDLILPGVHLDAARRLLPHAQTHLFPGTGHMPQIERAEEFAELAGEFLSLVDQRD
jgi:pimeloyl-ACP methyl ester carboxylesterase